jgi:hypothetical protein
VPSVRVGDRIWLEVVERESEDPLLEELGQRRGRLGTVLLGQDGCCKAADLGWAWGIATNGALVRLPGETPASDSDPFNRPVVASIAERLYVDATRVGALAEVLNGPWTTNGELLEAAYRLGWPYPEKTGWVAWGRDVEEVVDGESP